MRRLLLLGVLVVSGCGGSSSEGDRAGRPDPAPAGAEVKVIRAWADDLRRGDLDAAAGRFALPVVVANGGPEQELTTRAQVVDFNEALPCGAQLLRTRRHFGVVIADFKLTARPGGDCGSGTGGTASTAFEIRGGRIVRWLRVQEGSAPEPSGEVI